MLGFEEVRVRVTEALAAAVAAAAKADPTPGMQTSGEADGSLDPISQDTFDCRIAILRAMQGDDAQREDTLNDSERSTVELVMRMFMETCLGRAKQPGQTFESAGVPALLDTAIALTTANITDLNTPFALLEDLFDSQVISASEALFGLLEERASALSVLICRPDQKLFVRAKLTFLRTILGLLRRLSKSKNTNFCGRVLLLGAFTLPLSERSGINFKGNFAASQVEVADEMGEEAIVGDGEANGADIDFGFYTAFWSLQKAFCSPSAAVGAEAWSELHARIESVLQVFGSFASADAAEESGASTGLADSEAEVAKSAAEETVLSASAATAVVAMEVDEAADGAQTTASREVYFAKFLTSPKLMGLQLRDCYFRRHMLVQLLIFLQTLSTERKGAPSLDAEQRVQVESLQHKCHDLLKGIAPNGAVFAATVSAMLKRELHWVSWKREGCVPFDKVVAQAKEGKKRPSLASARPAKRLSLGNSELSRLWNLGGNSLESIAETTSKQQVPSLAEYLAPVVEQMDPEAGIEEEYKLKNDKVYTWKALRLMAKEDVSLLAKVSAARNGSIEAAASFMVEKSKAPNASADEPSDVMQTDS